MTGEYSTTKSQNTHEIKQRIEVAATTRQKTNNLLRKLAKDADSIHQGCAAGNRNANITGAIGGGFLAIAGGVTFAGDGLAASMVLASLTLCGSMCSIGAGYWCIRNQYEKEKRNNELLKEILDQLAEDEKVLNEMETIYRRAERGDFGEPSNIFRALHISAVNLQFCISSDVVRIDKLLEVFPPVESCISSAVSPFLRECLPLAAEKATLEGMEIVAEESAASAVKFMHNGLVKNFVKRHAVIAAKNAYEEVVENALVQVAQHTARETAKTTVSEAAKEAATNAARSAAKRAADESAKTLAKVKGSVTAVFGVLTSVWEGYNAYQNHGEMKIESQLGRELRHLADRMEKALNNIRYLKYLQKRILTRATVRAEFSVVLASFGFN